MTLQAFQRLHKNEWDSYYNFDLTDGLNDGINNEQHLTCITYSGILLQNLQHFFSQDVIVYS